MFCNIGPGCHQGEHEGQEVDKDGNAPGSESQHLLDLDPLKLGKIISGKNAF
jgi:hypothetical protein